MFQGYKVAASSWNEIGFVFEKLTAYGWTIQAEVEYTRFSEDTQY